MLALFAGEIVLKHGDDVFSMGRRQKRGDLSGKLPCCAEQIHAILCEIECFVLIPELLRKFREDRRKFRDHFSLEVHESLAIHEAGITDLRLDAEDFHIFGCNDLLIVLPGIHRIIDAADEQVCLFQCVIECIDICSNSLMVFEYDMLAEVSGTKQDRIICDQIIGEQLTLEIGVPGTAVDKIRRISDIG